MGRARCIALVVIAFLVLSLVPLVRPAVAAGSADLVISQVYGGGGNSGATLKNDFIELFNRGTASVTVTGWSVQYAAATGTTWQVTALSGAIGPGRYYLVKEAAGAGGTTDLPAPDATGGIPMSATSGKVALVKSAIALTGACPIPSANIADFVGYGAASCFEDGGAAPTLSNTTAALRGANGCTDSDANNADFAAGPPNPRNSASARNLCTAPGVASTSPGAGAPDVALDANITITFNQAVIATDPWFAIGCGDSGAHSATVSGGPITYSLDPTNSFATAETCTVTVFASRITDTGTPPVNMALDYAFGFTTIAPIRRIHEVQGAAQVSPFNGQLVSQVPGVVTAKRTNGFYMQDPLPDPDDATSEGIFVFTVGAPTSVSVGDSVTVSARVGEFRPGGAATNLSTTELDTPSITVLSHTNALPPATVIGIGGRIPPKTVIENDASGDIETQATFDPSEDGLDFYESLEGMIVQINHAVVVGPDASFGEVSVLPDDGAGAGPRTARAGIRYTYGDGNPERIMLDDEIVKALSGTNANIMPLVNVGDHFRDPVVGIVDYNFGLWMVEVLSLPVRVPDGVSRETTTAPAPIELTVATFNFENLDPTDPPSKFASLAEIIVNNLLSPDVIGGEEIQDNNGATDNGTVDADLTIGQLIAAIQAAGGPLYGYRQINPVNDQDGGEPGGNIRQIFLFRTDRPVTFVDRAGGGSTVDTAVLNVGGSPQLSASPGRLKPTDPAFNTSRKPLAAEITFGGRRFFLVGNHFNSKGGDQPLMGRFQPPTRSSEVQRGQQATIVRDFVRQIYAIDRYANVVVLGDLNDFEFSNTLGTLKGAPLNALIETLPENERYTYVFEGNSQSLDHILVSNSLLAGSVLDIVHVNSEFADQASDHEPQVARITLDITPPTIAAPSDVAAGTGPGAVACGVVISDSMLGLATANDNAPGVTVTRSGVPAGNLFPVGTTAIVYTATDASGNTATDTQLVMVSDDTPPAITAPPAVSVRSNVGATYVGPIGTATASDNCGGTIVIASDAPAAFPLGTTNVTWTATDAVGNVGTAIQEVTVVVGNETSLCVVTRRVVSKDGVAGSLCAKLDAAAAALARGNDTARRNALAAYVNEVNAQRGKAIAGPDADALIALARTL